MSHSIGPLWALAAALLLSACGTAPLPPDAPPRASFDAVAAVTAIRAAGRADAGELDVQPLRDPRVEDLREQGAALEARRMYRAAADVLDAALATTPDDPALLQERAELALLLEQLPEAERHARRALAAGAGVGPLCRRHWETIAQVRGALASATAPAGAVVVAPAAADTADARRQRDACTVTAPNRF